MKVIVVIAILIGIGLPILIYKKNKELKELLISFVLLGGIVGLLIVGNVTRAVLPIYLTHIVTIIFAYISYIIYLFRSKFYWYLYFLPLANLIFYVFLSFVGNRHISWF
jgi:hypothetical protein